MSERSENRFRRIALFALLQVMVTLALGEVAVRVLSGANETIRQLTFNPRLAGGHEASSTLEDLLANTRRGFKPLAVAGGFRTNSSGLRTREYAVARAPETYRVVTLGDSFTFASGLTPFRDHWPALFGHRLRTELGVPAEVINLGYPGVGPLFELRMWQLEGSRLSPDLVVLAFYVGNDFMDGREPLTAATWIDVLAEHSHLVRVVRNLYRYKQAEKTVVEVLGEEAQESADGTGSTSGGVELYSHQPEGRGNKPTMPIGTFERLTAYQMDPIHSSHAERFEVEFERVARVLDELRDSVQTTGFRFLLLIVPSEYQVDPRVAALGAEARGYRLADYDLHRPQRLLLEWCSATGTECLDLLPRFLQAGPSARLYRMQDTHWSVAGNALGADALIGWARHGIDTRPFAGIDFEADPLYDLDNDGVADHLDVCPGTVIPEPMPEKKRRRAHFVLADDDFVFDAVGERSAGVFTTESTRGCSCEQILRVRGLWEQRRESGCPERVLRNWVSSI